LKAVPLIDYAYIGAGFVEKVRGNGVYFRELMDFFAF
jgi:hypothetical protein